MSPPVDTPAVATANLHGLEHALPLAQEMQDLAGFPHASQASPSFHVYGPGGRGQILSRPPPPSLAPGPSDPGHLVTHVLGGGQVHDADMSTPQPLFHVGGPHAQATHDGPEPNELEMTPESDPSAPEQGHLGLGPYGQGSAGSRGEPDIGQHQGAAGHGTAAHELEEPSDPSARSQQVLEELGTGSARAALANVLENHQPVLTTSPEAAFTGLYHFLTAEVQALQAVILEAQGQIQDVYTRFAERLQARDEALVVGRQAREHSRQQRAAMQAQLQGALAAVGMAGLAGDLEAAEAREEDEA